MTRRVRALGLTLAAFVALLSGVPRASEASLIGDPATCAVTHALNVVTCVPASATVGGGSEFIFPSIVGDLFSVDVAASSITLAFLPSTLE